MRSKPWIESSVGADVSDDDPQQNRAKRPAKRVDPDTIETYWACEITTTNGMNQHVGNRTRSLVIFYEDTLGKAIQSILKNALYYIGACGYEVQFSMTRFCVECGGKGEVPNKRSKWGPKKECSSCKGVGKFEQIKDLSIVVPENYKVVEEPKS